MSEKKATPEVIAVITAAVQQAMGGAGKVVAVKIKTNANWALANKNRIKL